MQTELAKEYLGTPNGEIAESILRKCVHCGFCLATCPTYQLLGNELDGPRGRIYLIKQVLEGENPTATTQLHLDRCLTCRSCESTCPSGVRYAQLLEVGREVVESKVPRTLIERMKITALSKIVPNHLLVSFFLALARFSKPFLPGSIKKKIPPKHKVNRWPISRHKRRMILHRGCIQRVTNPNINSAAARYLNRHSITAVSTTDVCCGAVSLHNSDKQGFMQLAKSNINAWWPYIENGVEAVVSTASGCGVTIKEYGELLQFDKEYAEKAEKVASMALDISEVQYNPAEVLEKPVHQKVAFHSPCTLQHGQKIINSVESILHSHGIETTLVENSHLCCGSAGTYSLLQPKIANQLLDNKIAALQKDAPECIATANIGCLMHLATRATVPVKHWIEIVEPDTSS